ncbi:MAG: hypothetical protein V4662_19565 [Verrucomicrobiota bacterium]
MPKSFKEPAQLFIIPPLGYVLLSFYLLYVSELNDLDETLLVMIHLVAPVLLLVNTLLAGIAFIAWHKRAWRIGWVFMISLLAFLFTAAPIWRCTIAG